MTTVQTSELEEIARISRESQSIAKDTLVLDLENLRKGESIVVKMIGGWGKAVSIPYGQFEKEAEETFYHYEFEIVEGVGLLDADLTIVWVWNAHKIYFRKFNPMIQKGHREFRITKMRARDRNEWGIITPTLPYMINPGDKIEMDKIGAKPNYEIVAMDEADPALVIPP